MTRKLIEVPKDATLHAKEAVRTIAACGRRYMLQIPQAFRRKGMNYTVYAFAVEDWLGYHSVRKALAQVNFRRGYIPLVFLQNPKDYKQKEKMDIFSEKIIKIAGNPSRFSYTTIDSSELISHEELIGLPVNDESDDDADGLERRLKEVKHISEIG